MGLTAVRSREKRERRGEKEIDRQTDRQAGRQARKLEERGTERCEAVRASGRAIEHENVRLSHEWPDNHTIIEAMMSRILSRTRVPLYAY